MRRAAIITFFALALAAAGQTSRTAQPKTGPAAAKATAGVRKPTKSPAASTQTSVSKKSTGQARTATRSSVAAAKKPATAKAKAATRRRTAARRPPVQQRPTQERYAEIQQALIDRGFLEGPASGIWDQASIEALKRFQASEKLEPTGKITALSLIRLGLGPRRNDVATSGGLPANEAGVNP